MIEDFGKENQKNKKGEKSGKGKERFVWRIV